ncbi:MAG: hypothetical protein JAY71_18845 [Candidatus Thiodiazotropha weberae]|nr:hypothetical protein [Candidatus Thiodiazotropha weberae]
MKQKKTITIDPEPGLVSERLCQAMENAKTTRMRGQSMTDLRQWLFGGYLLSELGHGIGEYMLAMDRIPDYQNRSASEKIRDLIRFMERCHNSSTHREASREASPVVKVENETVEAEEEEIQERDNDPEDLVIKAKRRSLTL